VIADFDGNGSKDIVVVNHAAFGADTISMFLNNGDGTFAPQVVYPAGARPYWAVSGDFDLDGDADVAVSNYWGASVSVLLNDGLGVLAAPVEHPVGTFPTMMDRGDFNGDGIVDLAVASELDWTVAVLLGDGLGGFAPRVDYAVSFGPYGVTAADLDGNGSTDIAAANYGSGVGDTISVLLNNGDGTFAGHVEYTTDLGPIGVSHGDLDGDGDIDLAAACSGAAFDGTSIGVLLNAGDGTFVAAPSLSTEPGPYSLWVGDLNGDAVTDVAAANEGIDGLAAAFTIILGAGGGAFEPTLSFATGAGPIGVTAGDLDGSGTPEIAIACYGSDEIWIHFNQFPGIVSPPSDATVAVGGALGLTVVAGGPGPFSYQWRKDGVDLIDDLRIAGSSSSALVIDPVAASDAGAYDVVVTNDCGETTSAAAVVTLMKPSCPGDLDGSGDVGLGDLLAVLAAWGPCAGCPEDLDATGDVGLSELLTVLAGWGPC